MVTTENIRPLLSTEELLKHWQGHRGLTRRVIEAFTEEDLFTFSIGGMRPFAGLVKEFLAIAVPGLKEIVTGVTVPFDEERKGLTTKAELLKAWDEATEQIEVYWRQIGPEKFHETHKLFGEYEFPVVQNILYAIENEIHHRGQGYVYLRALGVEPPFFWEREF